MKYSAQVTINDEIFLDSNINNIEFENHIKEDLFNQIGKELYINLNDSIKISKDLNRRVTTLRTDIVAFSNDEFNILLKELRVNLKNVQISKDLINILNQLNIDITDIKQYI